MLIFIKKDYERDVITVEMVQDNNSNKDILIADKLCEYKKQEFRNAEISHFYVKGRTTIISKGTTAMFPNVLASYPSNLCITINC